MTTMLDLKIYSVLGLARHKKWLDQLSRSEWVNVQRQTLKQETILLKLDRLPKCSSNIIKRLHAQNSPEFNCDIHRKFLWWTTRLFFQKGWVVYVKLCRELQAWSSVFPCSRDSSSRFVHVQFLQCLPIFVVRSADAVQQITISIILGDPGVVSRVDKMFVVKVYRKIDLPVNFHHEHFIDPTNCPWVSQDGYQCALSANWQTQQRSTRLQNRRSAFLLSSKTVLQGAKGDLSFDLSLARS